jgi:hypothetical protein
MKVMWDNIAMAYFRVVYQHETEKNIVRIADASANIPSKSNSHMLIISNMKSAYIHLSSLDTGWHTGLIRTEK